MDALIDFGRGPLFRLCFPLMVLGLLRVLFLSITATVTSYRRSQDKNVPWKDVFYKTIGWLIPIRRLLNKRPAYSMISVLFHAGLILVPLFYSSHVLLWKNSTGFSWPSLNDSIANWLTYLCIVCGFALFLMRVFYTPSRALSRKQDYFWLLILLVPFITGLMCVHTRLSPGAYQWTIFLHIYSADLIMAVMPFTKIAHCVLAPLSQMVTAVGWKFPVGAGERVIKTLGYSYKPTWVEKSRTQ